MTGVTRPRGPLPARVYWTRRLLLLAVAIGLVFGVARVLGAGGGAPSPSARPVAATASTAPPAPSPGGSTPVGTPATPAPTSSLRPGDVTALAAPSGPCRGSDVVVTPSVKGPAYAGKPVRLTMTLVTRSSPACTFDVSAESLVVKITSGDDRIWSTQQCGGAVPRQAVVVRKDHPVAVTVVWNGLRSDAECTRSTPWAEPGYYHVTAASFGSEPVDRQFLLGAPPRPTITATPTPETPTASPSSR